MEANPFTQDEETRASTQAALLHQILTYLRLQRAIGNKNNPIEVPQELELIARVLAYVKIAWRRFVDTVPMRTEERFQRSLTEGLQDRLLDGLGIRCNDGEARCRAYLEELPETVERRKDLQAKLRILELANQELSKFSVG